MNSYTSVDFWPLLHELRTRMLRAMPPGARSVLSGGCSGSWYFQWFSENYPGIERHVGVEAFLPPPDVLPVGAEWHSSSLSSVPTVGKSTIDLVFGGQVIEHLWPEEAAGFLIEAHRVLRKDGLLVLDSPNRRLTPALAFENPGHTMEFTVDEIVRAVRLAGFEPTAMRGVWLCYDSGDHRVLPLDHRAPEAHWSCEDRISAAADRPEDSFVWWLEAKRQKREPDKAALMRQMEEVFDASRPVMLARCSNEVGEQSGFGRERRVTTKGSASGYLLRGPRVPVRAGRHVVRFEVGASDDLPADAKADAVACVLDVWSAESGTVLAQREVPVRDLPRGGLGIFELPCTLDKPAFGVEFRIRGTGQAGLLASLRADIVACDGSPSGVKTLQPFAGIGNVFREGRRGLRAPLRWLRKVRDRLVIRN